MYDMRSIPKFDTLDNSVKQSGIDNRIMAGERRVTLSNKQRQSSHQGNKKREAKRCFGIGPEEQPCGDDDHDDT